ncbi:MAG: hypothetical protein LBF82_00730 [Lactobacillales bacterium]|nr:hypothetical protein [Lactobacillales bacterium]
MVTNSLTKLFSSNPKVAEKISTLKTAKEIFSELKKHIPNYTEEQMKKDFAEIKASAEISSGGALDAEALENVAGGAWQEGLAALSAGFGALTNAVNATVQSYQQTKNAYDAFKQ